MNYYEQIRSKRNEMFPPVLEKGCEVFLGGFTNKVMINDKEYYEIGMVNGMKSEIGTLFDNMPKLEILGKELSLNDILLMLKDKWKNIGLTEKGVIFGDTNDSANFKKMRVELDLTKSIQDQTPEVLQKLLELIK